MLAAFCRVFLCLLVACSPIAFSKDILITEIRKDGGNWSVTYRSHQPITSIEFAISPDHSRLGRWTPISEGFELKAIADKEVILRRDGKPFNQISLTLTPTYIHLPKYYAPFSPFSNGDMLFHSARFFACPNLCSGYENTWYISLKVTGNETIVVNGHAVKGKASWYDKNDGIKVYVGYHDIKQYADYWAIVDAGLPKDVADSLNRFLPEAIALLTMMYGSPEQKPTLFASFGKTEDGRWGRQGGVLPGQIFMHWYGQVNEVNQPDLLWFFAHEAAHMYQGYQKLKIDKKDAWIQEGHAEYVASRLLFSLSPDKEAYVNSRLEQADIKCQKAREDMPISHFAANGRFQDLYHCGLMFFDFIDSNSTKANASTIKLWRDIQSKVGHSRHIDTSVMAKLAAEYLDKTQYAILEAKMGWK